MADHNDIYSIVERLRILEEGLDKNQKSVDQLSATFKPKTVAVLTAKKDPKNPMAGKLVGGNESVNNEKEMAEDVLDKVKKSFADYLKNVADEIKTDSDLKDKKKEDGDIKKKDKKDRDLIAKVDKHLANIDEDPLPAVAADASTIATDVSSATGSGPQIPPAAASTPTVNPTMPESAPVKTVELSDGVICEIHGDEHKGFEIRRGNRSMPSRFKDLSQAEMALDMFKHRLQKKNDAQDYVDEA